MEQQSFDLTGADVTGPPLDTTTVKHLPAVKPEITPLVLAQAIVDFVECERAYIEQASTHRRVKPHADGAEAKLPRVRRRLQALAAAIAKANGVVPSRRGKR